MKHMTPCPSYDQSATAQSRHLSTYPQLPTTDLTSQYQLQHIPQPTTLPTPAPSGTEWPTYMVGINTNACTQMCIKTKFSKHQMLALWDTGTEISVLSK